MASNRNPVPAEGARKASKCNWCRSPVWVVYHGPKSNHTLEPRSVSLADDPEAVERAAKAFYEDRVHRVWSYDSSEDTKERYRESMRAALRAAQAIEEGDR